MNIPSSTISKSVYLTLTLITVFVVVNSLVFYPSNIISYDVFGYYIYLPLSFIVEGDSQDALHYLNEIKTTYESSETLYQIQHLPNGDFVMKYTSGWAVCYAPFFFIAHGIASLTGYATDGFSQPYQISIFIGSLIYTLIGIYFLFKIARYFFQKRLAIILLVSIILGTNYLLHITMFGQNAMTHNLLFTGYTLIVWLTIQWYEKRKIKTILLLGVVCGLVILTRPTEIVCLLIPLLWPLGKEIKRYQLFKKKFWQLFVFAAIVILIGSIQLFYWKIQTGHALFFDYGNPAEGLDFLAPHTLDTLFSFRKGWYIYTPLMFLATLGFIPLFVKNRRLFLPLFLFFIANLYLVSSWSCWWYAASFSQRALIPSMVIMCIPLGYLIIYFWAKAKLIRSIFAIIVILIIALNIFQTVQFYKEVIPGDRMTKAYYMATFGSLAPNQKLKDELLLVNRQNPEQVNFRDTKRYTKRVVHFNNFEDSSGANNQMSYSGSHSMKLNLPNTFTPAFNLPFNELTSKDHAFIRITARVYKTEQAGDSPSLLIASFEYQEETYNWQSQSIETIETNQWGEAEMIYLTPETRTLNDKIKVYLWHRSNTDLFIDDFKVEVYEPID